MERKVNLKKIKVLIIEAGSEMEMGIPPNIAVLVAALKQNSFDVKVFSTNEYRIHNKTGDDSRIGSLQVPPTNFSNINIKYKESNVFSDFRSFVKKFKPDIIGLSTTESVYETGIQLLQFVRDINIFTIVGGAYAILSPENIIKEECVDAVCIGEGEKPLIQLCESFYNNKINYNIKNIWFKKDGKVIRNSINELLPIDSVPFQDWSVWDIPPRAYKPMAGKIRITALVELTRGCPFNCNYCANNFLNKKFKHNYREKSIDRFIEEIKYLKKMYNVEFIYIADETILTTSKKRFEEFVHKYSEINLPFWCETRPEFITYEKIKMLKNIGLESINIGIESGNYEFRKTVLNRDISNNKIINSINKALEVDVKVGINIIIGFPYETRDLIFETIELARDIKPTSCMVHLFQPYVKTPLRKSCINLGLIENDYVCGDYRIDAISTDKLLRNEILGLHRTFNLYVDFLKERWEEIKEAESMTNRGNILFSKLAREYQLKHFGITSF